MKLKTVVAEMLQEIGDPAGFVTSCPGSDRHCSGFRDIGFTDNSNPFYLFSKLNAGLLLLAPAAPTMHQEHPLLIARRGGEVDIHAKNHNRRTGGRFESYADALVPLYWPTTIN